MKFSQLGFLSLLASALAADQRPNGGQDGRVRTTLMSKQFASAARDGRSHANPSLRRLRDYFVEFIFGNPAARVDTKPVERNIWAAYGGEVVVRFNITDPFEEAAISDAVERLFKDVWSYGPNYVDIRMHRDDVAPFLSLIPKSLHASYYTLIPDLASLVRSTYPPKYLSDGYVDMSPETSSTLGPQLPTHGDNVFFENYQPLPVRPPPNPHFQAAPASPLPRTY